MGCSRLCTAEKIFIFINIAFAMYSGALLATAARLAWDPSTYAWFRFLCAAQYRVSAGYVAASGLWLAALVYLAASAGRARAPLLAYAAGVLCLALSELAYAAWMAASLVAWWRDSPQAALARRGADLLHDVKPALRAMTRHQDVVRPLLDMIEEVEHEAPNNVFVIIVFGAVGMLLQVGAFVMARRLARSGAAPVPHRPPARKDKAAAAAAPDDSDGALSDRDSERLAAPAGWRRNANLRMYTILDKIF